MHASKNRIALPSFQEAFGPVIDAYDALPPPDTTSNLAPQTQNSCCAHRVADVPMDSLHSSSPSDTTLRRKRSWSVESSASSGSSSRSSLVSTPTSPPHKRVRGDDSPRSQGFIILRPSSDGYGLHVAATSTHSFTDALDALRHRTVPQSRGADDGDCFLKEQTPKTLFTCPFESCGRKYTFTSNLRRHMRKAHQLKRTGPLTSFP
ncbi:hypothetical protein EXIGLDRAFT_842785 [Exidia glandulosa HHB12029]|uniref:C2H2-type domain-containing protein n=1 Tax=Exidia glandulosa HHB12029 TaxID=1314781 RepID=A0A165D1U5_EXIGL|nr:hypothetical protein EXIGLDRAFT_842785 [Exidia glandulosa HHB12029]